MKNRKTTLLLFLMFISMYTQAQSWYTSDVDKKADEILKKMTVEEKLSFISGVDWMYTKNIDRLGIQRMKMSDGPQGLGTHGKSTAYPATVLLAATWNDELVYEFGKSLGRDCKARGINVLLGPGVNIYRAPMCGRNFEYMGEDPYLAARTSTGYIKGVQDQGIMAVIKHFSANNSDYDRHEISNDIDERALHEIYFPAFKAAVQEAGVAAVMSSYNLIHGVYTTESPWLLKEVLRNQWGFNGLLMSDWGSTHHCIPSMKAGLDLEMPGGVRKPEELAYYLKTGDITMGMIDEMVRRILRVMVAFDFKDGLREDKSIPQDDPKAAETALNVAREGIVLLKNEDGILPLKADKIKKVAVVGQNALRYLTGGGSGRVTPIHYVSFYDGIKAVGAQKGIEVKYVDEYDHLDDCVFVAPGSDEHGFKGEYFNNTDLTGSPAATKTDVNINFNFQNGVGIEGVGTSNYSVRWTAELRPVEDGEYIFHLGGDDGFRLYIDNKKLKFRI